jgi:hypothetical protein
MVLYPSADEIRQRQQQAANTALTSMSGQQGQSTGQSGFLSQNQQDLLLAALNSQAGGAANTFDQRDINGTSKSTLPEATGGMTDPAAEGLFMSPQEAELDQFNGDYTPDLDYLDGDNFDFENADLGGEMIGALPGDRFDLHDKRKNPDEDDDDEDGDAKRQDTQDGEKGAKKPGRKPLTSEPTTVSPELRYNAGTILIQFSRNGKHRIEPRNVRFASARRNTSKTWRQRSPRSPRHKKRTSTKTGCSRHRLNGCRSN